MANYDSDPKPGRACQGVLHTVERGDTLYLLGKKYGVRVSAIMMANPYVDVYNLQVGDELCIPKFTQNVPLRGEAQAAPRPRRANRPRGRTYDTIDYDYADRMERRSDDGRDDAYDDDDDRRRVTDDGRTVRAETAESEAELGETLKELRDALSEIREYMGDRR